MTTNEKIMAQWEEEAAIAAEIDADFAAGKLTIESGWLVEVHDEHTCAGGTPESNGMHEPGCGLVPLINLAALFTKKETL